MAELRALLTARERLYGQARLIVDTSACGPEEVARTIHEKLAGAEGVPA
jgi:chloramphenicol 3-O-phosphotransferase